MISTTVFTAQDYSYLLILFANDAKMIISKAYKNLGLSDALLAIITQCLLKTTVTTFPFLGLTHYHAGDFQL